MVGRKRTKTAQRGKMDPLKETYSSLVTNSLQYSSASSIWEVLSLLSFKCSQATVTSQEQGLSTAQKQQSQVMTGVKHSQSPESSVFTTYFTRSASDWPISSGQSSNGSKLQGNGLQGGKMGDREDMDPQRLQQRHSVRQRKALPSVSAAE